MIKDCAVPREDLDLSGVTHDLLIAWRHQILERAFATTSEDALSEALMVR